VRTLLRLGCEEVYIVYRRTRKEMPANEVEIVASEHEGHQIQVPGRPTRVIDDGQGNVAGLEYLKMELGEPDASGRRRPVPIEGSETVSTSTWSSPPSARGRTSASWKKNRKENINHHALEHLRQRSGNPAVQRALSVHRRRRGHRALSGGGRHRRRAAGGPLHPPVPHRRGDQKVPEIPAQAAYPRIPVRNRSRRGQISPRTPMPELPVAERIDSMIEVDQVISEADAKHESSRCLNCCRICYNPECSIWRLTIFSASAVWADTDANRFFCPGFHKRYPRSRGAPWNGSATDLVGAAGTNIQFQQDRPPENRSKTRQWVNAAEAVREVDGHFFAVHRMATDGKVNGTGIILRDTVNQGEIMFADFS
jgi:hypothetical protein